jgi:phage virion morphogenesis protein
MDIKIDLSDIKQLGDIAERLEQRAPLMSEISHQMLDAIDENFAQEGRPKWLGITHRDGKVLQDSGRLAASMTPFSDNDTAAAGTNVIYAAIHHFGGQTKPHTIRPRYKKALKFNGRFRKVVNHPGSKIPARPIFVMTNNDTDRIEQTTLTYIHTGQF